MSEFKSGIILRNKCIIVQDDNESHTELLKNLKIDDTYENATRTFVRAELVPPDSEWWTDPSTWKFIVDQDILPDWFEDDEKRYEFEFREEVSDWATEHIFIDKQIEVLSDGYYRLKRCCVAKISRNAVAVVDDSNIEIMERNAIISYMYGKSCVDKMINNSEVDFIYDFSVIREMHDRSNITKMHNQSSVDIMYDNAYVNEMYDNSSVKEMHENSRIWAMHDKATGKIIRKNERGY